MRFIMFITEKLVEMFRNRVISIAARIFRSLSRLLMTNLPKNGVL